MLEREWDKKDLGILEILQEQARISNSDLAQRVGLSPSPCWRRVRALEDAGVIQQYVTLEKQIEKALEVFEKAVAERPEVMECYLMTGEFDYLLRVVVPDLEAYEHFLLQHLPRIKGIASIKSSFSLKQVCYKTTLPLPR